jgi:predicted small lipoprotein YifL
MEGEARMTRAGLGMLAAALMLAACGKVGPVRPPGPPDQITYPRQYPAPEPAPAAQGMTVP